jgi:ABC-type phosphate transport system substrate-binding protein
MKFLRPLSLALLLGMTALPAAAADWALVANPRAGIGRLTHDEVTNIYLGRYRRLASGTTAEPLDQPADSALRAAFYRQLVDKSLAEINAYWARLIFSGKTQPPHAVSSSEDALQRVARSPGALAYVERSKVDARVTIVFEISD